MGIQGLTKLLTDHAPGCMKEQKFNNYFGRKLAIDASMSIYQFLIVVGRVGDQLLTSEAGEVTSHLQGMFYRTARMLEAGMKPAYVFDGPAPELKRAQLDERLGRREEAQQALAEATEAGKEEDVEKYSKRTVRVTNAQVDERRRLLQLMGVPIVDAPSEAEAQCAAMAKAGVVHAAASEDMDSLTFGAPRLVRHLMAPQTQQQAHIIEFDHEVMLQQLGLSRDEFMDMCILCGCDYCGRIKGLGPVRALQLIQKHKTIEEVLANIDRSKYPVPDDFPYAEARQLFKAPDVISVPDASLKWAPPDEEGLVQFLVHEKNFNEERVRATVKKVVSGSKSKASQGRIEQFFTVTTKPSTAAIGPSQPHSAKRPAKPQSKKPTRPSAAVGSRRGEAAGKRTAAPPADTSYEPPAKAPRNA